MSKTSLLVFMAAAFLVMWLMLRCLFRMESGKPLPIDSDLVLRLVSLGLGALAYTLFAMSAYFLLSSHG
jgi:hypothetical protein